VSRSEAVFGKYRLVQQLDDIEIGEAHLAKLVRVEGFEKLVVIWRVGHAATRDLAFIEAAMLEAKRAASLSHANIAQVLDLGVIDGMCFVATEYVPGRTLEAVLGIHSELDWRVTVYIAAEVAGALSYAQGRRTSNGELLRLVHRRLSPSQIALGSAGDVKVTGFGTPWALTSLDDYRSPEEARGEPVDGRADVFALGAVLRRCVPEARVPDALLDAIDRAIHPYPEQRPTATELHEDLTGLLHTAKRPVAPREIAELASVTEAQGPIPPEGFITDAIERIEQTLDAMSLETSTDLRAILPLYEQLGRLCLEAHLGARGAARMTRALDLADGLGHDDYAALFCTLHGRLLAQASRTDESRDWLERAAAFRT
jgi:serine/threonine protein kinase